MKYLLTTLSTLIILLAVLLPGSKVPDVDIVGIDKAAHFILFAMWIIAVRHDFDQGFKWAWALLVGLTFSVMTEVLQITVEAVPGQNIPPVHVVGRNSNKLTIKEIYLFGGIFRCGLFHYVFARKETG